MPTDIILLYMHACMCTINEDHKIYFSWNIRCNREKFFSFWAIFCPFSPLTTRKTKILKLKKTPGHIIMLHICTINDNHMIYGSWDMERNRKNFFSHSGPFFALLPPYEPRKSKFWKNEKNTWRYIILQMCTINDNHTM